MVALSSNLRRQLERTVVQARDLAEEGSRAALEVLAVGEPEPFTHMDSELRALRRRLRAHARQLGDRPTPTGAHGIERLVHECAYEHWHAMLFARFLAENDLLIEPETDTAVTLDECEELAAEEEADKWLLAARFAQRMLPQVFRPDHPVFGVVLAREHRLKLESMVEILPSAVFKASDALGWVYQFWQSNNKDKVNRAELKIGADELPAVTQLFTEPYMVQFLLHNTLGAWWAAHHSDALANGAASEEELRRRGSIPGVPLEYLRFVRTEDANGDVRWQPAAGTFDHWPEHLRELKVIDPCCGSGHFLVAVLSMLVPMRMALEGLNARDAVDAVLRDNLHGLELDARCVELAVFAVALAAWGWPGAGGYRPLPNVNIAHSGRAVGASRESWTALASAPGNLRVALGWMYDAFKNAPLLGSLLNPAATEATKIVDWPVLSESLTQALVLEQPDERREAAVAAHGLAKAAELLVGQYHWVVTNVPYLARGKQIGVLRDFCERHYGLAKQDLATVFLERCLDYCGEVGTTSLVLPQNWLFLAGYSKFRQKLLRTEAWHLLARLGPGAFETISGEVVKAILFVLSRDRRDSHVLGLLSEPGGCCEMSSLDVSEHAPASEKSRQLREAEVRHFEQAGQLNNPDAIVAPEVDQSSLRMWEFAQCVQGTSTGDNPRFIRRFWERMSRGSFSYFQMPSTTTVPYGGKECVVDWQGVCSCPSSAIRGEQAWTSKGIALGQMQSIPSTLYGGTYFSNSTPVVVAQKTADLPALWCYCSSPEFGVCIAKTEPKAQR